MTSYCDDVTLQKSQDSEILQKFFYSFLNKHTGDLWFKLALALFEICV